MRAPSHAQVVDLCRASGIVCADDGLYVCARAMLERDPDVTPEDLRFVWNEATEDAAREREREVSP